MRAFRQPYSTDRFRVTVDFPSPTRTHQSFKDECDINNILAGYERTGMVTHINANKGFYEDVTNATSYHDAINTLLEAREAFMDLPAKVRKHFDNDPALFLESFEDPDQRQTLVDLGLIVPTETARSHEPNSLAPAEPVSPPADG